MSEFVRIRHPETSGESDVPADSVPAWQARGWEVVSEPRSYGRAQDEETLSVQQATADAARARTEAAESAGDTVKQVLERVGTDPAAAAEELRAENGKTQPRVTLVAELERIAGSDPRAAADETEE